MSIMTTPVERPEQVPLELPRWLEFDDARLLKPAVRG
jgi:hypothetical protein